jgi:hypothetical protein
MPLGIYQKTSEMTRNQLKKAWEAMRMIVTENYEHPHYADTVARYKKTKGREGKEILALDGGAAYWKAVVTGEVGELITQIHTRESEAQKDQRVRLNNPITPEMAAMCRNPLQKLFRSNGVRRSVTVGGDKQAVIDERLNGFSGDKDIYDWMGHHFVRLNEIDPNAWWVLLFEQHEDDFGTINEAPTPLPIIYPSESVVYFDDVNGKSDLLCVRQNHTGRDEKNGKEVRWLEWIMYGKGFAIRATEVTTTAEHRAMREQADSRPNDAIPWPAENKQEYGFDQPNGKPRVVFIEFMKLDSVETPFERFGVRPDELTGGKTMASVHSPAKEVFDEAVLQKTEAEVIEICHAFPHKHQFQPPCDNVDRTAGKCRNGTMSITGHVCQKCSGTGLLSHSSASDVIAYPMPDNPQELLPLAQMVFYESIPLESLELLLRQLDEKGDRAMKAIWGVSGDTPKGNAANPVSVQMTATEFRGRYESLNNALTPYRGAVMRQVKKLIRLTANYAEVTKLEVNQTGFKAYSKSPGVEIVYEIPDKTELPTIDELTLSRQQAVASNAPIEILSAIDLEMIERQFGVDSEEARWFAAKTKHRPFTGKTEAEIAVIMAARPDGDYYKTLWLYFDSIFSEIRIDEPMFLKMDFGKQREMVKTKVGELQEIEKANAPALNVAQPLQIG